jgi:hypothetical protein
VQTLLFLRDTFHVDNLVGVTKNKTIRPATNDWNFELARTVMLDFLFRNWCATFGVLLNPVRNLLLRISIKNILLSSISGRVQDILECQSEKIS